MTFTSSGFLQRDHIERYRHGTSCVPDHTTKGPIGPHGHVMCSASIAQRASRGLAGVATDARDRRGSTRRPEGTAKAQMTAAPGLGAGDRFGRGVLAACHVRAIVSGSLAISASS